MENKKLRTNIVIIFLLMTTIFFSSGVLALKDSLSIGDYFVDINSDENDVEAGETFKLEIEVTNDDDILKENVQINLDLNSPFDEVDSDSKNLGNLEPGESKSKTFRIEVKPNAKEDEYMIEIEIEDEEDSNSDDIYLDVSSNRPEIILGNIETLPGTISPNTQDIKVVVNIENTGEEYAKNIEISLNLPKGITPSYSNNNRYWIGRLNTGESKQIEFYIDVDESVNTGLYDFTYELKYENDDNDEFTDSVNVPFLVKSSPYLEVLKVEGTARVGSTQKVYVTLVNTGDEAAESVDVRIIKQNSQPFNFDVRSDYIGELKPGETGVAVFDIDTTNDANLKEYSLKLLVRAKGDSDNGNDQVYTFNRRVNFKVNKESTNKLAVGGIAGLALTLLLTLSLLFISKRK